MLFMEFEFVRRTGAFQFLRNYLTLPLRILRGICQYINPDEDRISRRARNFSFSVLLSARKHYDRKMVSC